MSAQKYFLLFFLLIPTISAVTLHGQIYDQNLKPLNNIIVQINTSPAQQVVTANGAYSFEIPEGTYKITATRYNNGLVVANVVHNVTIQQQGTFQLDLLLYTDIEPKQIHNIPWLWILFFVVFVLIVVLLFVLKFRKPVSQSAIHDPLIQEILTVLKKHEGRLSQKELRKELPWSESKISAVLAQLERDKLVDKIKKGRSNILILKQS